MPYIKDLKWKKFRKKPTIIEVFRLKEAISIQRNL